MAKYVDEEPVYMNVIDGYFLIRTLAAVVGILLYYQGYFYMTMHGPLKYFSFMFEDLAMFSISPLIPMVHAIAFGVVYWGLKKDIGIVRLLAVVLLFIDIFAFPVGTIISVILIVFLLHPQTVKYFTPIAKKNSSYRAIGLAILVFALVGFVITSGVGGFTGLSEEFIGLEEEPQLSAIDKISGTFDLDSVEEEDIIIQLRESESSMQAADLQSVMLQSVKLLGGDIQKTTLAPLNTITAELRSSRIEYLAKDPNVVRIVKDEPVVELMYEPMGSAVEEDYVWEPIKQIWRGNVTGTGKNVVIAVVDSGIDESIPAFTRENGENVIIDKYEKYGDYVYWHGTAVASVIASQGTEDYPFVKGIAPDADLLDVGVFTPDLKAKISDILDGWKWVVNWKKANPDKFVICSNSLGIPTHSEGILDAAADNMVVRYQIPMVVAAGNEHPQYRITSPGMAEYVLTVGAVDKNGNIASFSCRGPAPNGKDKPDVCALGVQIPAFFPHDNIVPIREVSGTSFSTPVVSAQFAVLAEEHPDYTIKDFYQAIKNGAVDKGEEGFDYTYGYGIANLEGAEASLLHSTATRYYVYLFALLPLLALVVMFFPEIDKKLKIYKI